MYELVEMKDNDIFTTSKIIADGTNNKHNSITAIIQKYEEDFREFGSVRFVDLKSKNPQGGRPEKVYYLNEEQATLLVMGFSGEKAMKFKLAYIKQFNQMEELLKGKVVEREKGIAIRQALTKAIEISGENERMHGHAYSTYTNLIYKSIFGKDAKHLREEYGISKKR